ncbi:hypothetical protein FA13DRAFT_1708645 [Coprinellus micaceus]|nr:hypothetical protein FA13DRAFT_1708645 [Coprinellus micaceus]
MSLPHSPPHLSEEQMSDPKALTAHFLNQVQIAHVRTRDREPVPLHFDSETCTMTQYLWPVDPGNGQRLAPSDFESHRRTHELRAPCCLCAFLEGEGYTESRIGIAETVTQDLTRNQSILNGEIVAVCGKQRCGYFLCLERFYPVRGLKSRICRERRVVLAPQDVLPPVEVDESFRVGDGLFQVMTNAAIRGKRDRVFQVVKPQKEVKQTVVRSLAKGISEEQFWATFVQCLVCKDVIFRETFGANHVCGIDVPGPQRHRHNPYATPVKNTSTTRSRVVASRRLQRTYALASISSPAHPETTRGAARNGPARHNSSNSNDTAGDTDTDPVSDSDELPQILTSDPDLPTLPQLFDAWRQEDLAARGSN